MNSARYLTLNVGKVRLGDCREQTDYLAREEPLEIQVSTGMADAREWKTVAITMRTPGHDRELAVGFLFGEGLLQSKRQIETVYSCGARQGEATWQNRVRLALTPETSFDASRLERNFYTTSSCGVCGKTSVEALDLSHFQKIPDAGWQLEQDFVCRLPEQLRMAQDVFEKTGGLHAAGLFSRTGDILAAREDVGRHNAMDKVIGAQILAGNEKLNDQVLVVSGRASFELVQKAIAAGVPVLVAVGAPSSLAVESAEAFGLTLIGFTKPTGFNIYTGAQRIRSALPAVLPTAA